MRALAALAFCCVTVAILYLFGPWIAVRLLAGPYWAHVRPLLLYITIAHTFYVMGNCVYTVLLALKRTHPLAWATSIAAAVQIVLNILLVPRWSIIAAAADTLASYALWFVIMTFVAYWYLWRRPNQVT